MKTQTLALCAALLATLAACDSGTWVDVIGPAGGCKGGKPAGFGIKTAEDVKMFGQAMCATRQKNYTGDFQCKGEDLQVKCK